MTKELAKIKHGPKIVDALNEDDLYFVHDIQRVTGLDEKTLRRSLNSLLKNGYLTKNAHSQWYIPREVA